MIGIKDLSFSLDRCGGHDLAIFLAWFLFGFIEFPYFIVTRAYSSTKGKFAVKIGVYDIKVVW